MDQIIVRDHLFIMSHNVTHGLNSYGEVNSKSANDGDDVLRDQSNLDCLTVWESIYVISTTTNDHTSDLGNGNNSRNRPKILVVWKGVLRRTHEVWVDLPLQQLQLA
jgi:hypothetical protein